MTIFSKKFLDYALERAMKSGAQQLILVVTAAGAFNVFEFDWATAAGLVLGAFVLSVATSVIAFQAVEKEVGLRDTNEIDVHDVEVDGDIWTEGDASETGDAIEPVIRAPFVASTGKHSAIG